MRPSEDQAKTNFLGGEDGKATGASVESLEARTLGILAPSKDAAESGEEAFGGEERKSGLR